VDQVVIARGWFNSDGEFGSNERSINDLLTKGWTVKMVTPLGAYGYGYGSVSVSAAEGVRLTNDRCEGSDNGFAALLVLTDGVD
jgi:hypothetical protein